MDKKGGNEEECAAISRELEELLPKVKDVALSSRRSGSSQPTQSEDWYIIVLFVEDYSLSIACMMKMQGCVYWQGMQVVVRSMREMLHGKTAMVYKYTRSGTCIGTQYVSNWDTCTSC